VRHKSFSFLMNGIYRLTVVDERWCVGKYPDKRDTAFGSSA